MCLAESDTAPDDDQGPEMRKDVNYLVEVEQRCRERFKAAGTMRGPDVA
jgi:hypothetical protein